MKKIITNSLLLIATQSAIALNAEDLGSVEVIGTQESYYEESSQTALKGDFLDNEIPYTTNVTTGTLINDIHALKLRDTLDYTTGVTSSGTSAADIVIRGVELVNENIQTDSMPGVTSSRGSISTANVEKIEILKGPAAILYGSMQAGGLVNIITKKPESKDSITIKTSIGTYATGVSSFGSNNSIVTSFDATGKVGDSDNLLYRFVAVGESFNSYRNNVEDDNIYLYPSLLWNIDDSSSLLTSMEFIKKIGSADDGLAALNDDISNIASIDTVYQEEDDFVNEQGATLNLTYNKFVSDSLSFATSFRSVYQNDERVVSENADVDDDNELVERTYRHQYNKRFWHTLDTNAKYKTEIADMEHNFLFGVTAAYRETDWDRRSRKGDATSVDIDNPTYGGDTTVKLSSRRLTKTKSLALYLQDKISLTDSLTGVASVRVDNTKIDYDLLRGVGGEANSGNKSTTDTSASLGLIYNINDVVSVYASYADSFDPASVESVDKDGNFFDSETAKQSEIGAKFNVSQELNIALSLYKINRQNIIENIDGENELSGDLENLGTELDIQWLPTKNWQFKFGAAYNDAEYVKGKNKGLESTNIAEKTAFIFARYNIPTPVFDGLLGFSAGAVYKGSVDTSSYTLELPSYTRYDVGAYYEKGDWKYSVNVKNLTDELYFTSGDEDSALVLGDPRNIVFSIETTF